MHKPASAKGAKGSGEATGTGSKAGLPRTSALAIVPPKELWPEIQAIRTKFDKAAETWPPHINLLFPFLPDDQFPKAVEKLKPALSEMDSFEVSLAAFDSFSHARTSTLFLNPTSTRLQGACEKVFPVCSDLSTISPGGWHGHLTLGQWDNPKELQKEQKAITAAWRPLVFRVTEVHLLHRRDATFVSRATVRLRHQGGADEEGDDAEA